MLFICPNCNKELNIYGNSFKCKNNHCFDIAKHGYVNLLPSNKNGSLIGDNKQMAALRKEFLNKDCYLPLANEIINIIKEKEITGNALDICCGEGYYTEKFCNSLPLDFYGFDISKEMIKKAASRKAKAHFFVANLAKIPLKSGKIDVATHLFAPFNASEFARAIKKGGYLLSVVPAPDHLFELKAAVYDIPYKNDENLPDITGFKLEEIKKLTYKFNLENNQDIVALFGMTPYFYKTSRKDMQKLEKLDSLSVTADFKILILKKE